MPGDAITTVQHHNRGKRTAATRHLQSGNPFVLRLLKIGGRRRGLLLLCAQIGSHAHREAGDDEKQGPEDMSHFEGMPHAMRATIARFESVVAAKSADTAKAAATSDLRES
jgi:hypothetical protein